MKLLDVEIHTVGNGYKVVLCNLWAGDGGVNKEFFFATKQEALEYVKPFVASLTSLDVQRVADKIILLISEN